MRIRLLLVTIAATALSLVAASPASAAVSHDEAVGALLRHAHEDLELSSFVAFIHANNGASRRVADKIGLLPAGETVLHGYRQLVYRLDYGPSRHWPRALAAPADTTDAATRSAAAASKSGTR